MKKTLATVACALAVVLSLSIVPGKKLGILGVDVVSAATGETQNTNTNTSTKTTYSTSSTISRVLKSGSKGNDVKTLQTLLNNNGYKLTVDGIFGNLTLNAVKDYQGKNGLAVDGMVGPKTLAKIAPATTTTTTTTSQITRLLRLGSKGDDVKLLQTWLNNNGNKLSVDGIFGNLTLAAVKDYQGKNGLAADGLVGPKTLAKITPAATPATPAAPTTPTTPIPTEGQSSIKIGRADTAAHGTKCFTDAVVAMAGDKIVAVSVDDYQFTAPTGYTAVPNSDKDFGKNYPAGQVLVSKRTNAAAYSAHMKEAGGATLTWDANMTAVEKFATGKTVAELEAAIKANGTDAKVDAVSGATFADTNGYLNAILAAAKDAKANTSVVVENAKLNTIKIGRVEAAAHGTKCFSVAVSVIVDNKIVADSVDDYQFTAPTGYTAVPNSDKDFGKNYPAGQVLVSKRTNAAAYSSHMKEAGGATLTWDANMTAVEKFATGKTVAELEAAIKANGTDAKVDAVSGATFADTNGYLNAILAAAKKAN